MFKITLVITLALVCISLISVSYSQEQANEPVLQVNVTPEKQTYKANEYPKLVGLVTDEAGNPIPKASVQITAAKFGVYTMTNSQGKFVFEQKVLPDEGVNIFNIKAKKDGFREGISATSILAIGANAQKAPTQVMQSQVPDQSALIKIMEEAKQLQQKVAQQEKKSEELKAQQAIIQKQREVAYANLLDDITKMEIENLPHTPRKAFEAFLSTVDEGFHSIFWSQFELTEKISQEAHQAKLKALQDGMSPAEAMKVYQKRAAISRGQLIDHNKNIQIQLGLADKNIQDLFDFAGKLPRIGN